MEEATQLLQVIYDQFIEGFDTMDLRDAKRSNGAWKQGAFHAIVTAA